jgi:hypothetical protein
MKKTLLRTLALPILAGTLLFTGCGPTRAEREKLEQQVDTQIKQYLAENTVQKKEVPKEKGLESYFFQDQELNSLSPIKGNIYNGDVEFQNLKIYTKGNLKEGGFGEEAEKVLQGAGQAEYFFPDGKTVHLVVFGFNSPELAGEMEKRINVGENITSPKFTFLYNNVLSYISQPDIPTFSSENMMSELDKNILTNIINNYIQRTGATARFVINQTTIEKPVQPTTSLTTQSSEPKEDFEMPTINRKNQPGQTSDNSSGSTPSVSSKPSLENSSQTIESLGNNSSGTGLEKYVFQTEDLGKNMYLGTSPLGYGFSNPLIKKVSELNADYKNELEPFNVESVAVGDYSVKAVGMSSNIEEIILNSLKFKSKEDLKRYLSAKKGEIHHCPIFIKGNILTVISPNIDDVYSEEIFGPEQEIIYEKFIKDYAKKLGVEIQLNEESKKTTTDLLNRIAQINKDTQEKLDRLNRLY